MHLNISVRSLLSTTFPTPRALQPHSRGWSVREAHRAPQKKKNFSEGYEPTCTKRSENTALQGQGPRQGRCCHNQDFPLELTKTDSPPSKQPNPNQPNPNTPHPPQPKRSHPTASNEEARQSGASLQTVMSRGFPDRSRPRCLLSPGKHHLLPRSLEAQRLAPALRRSAPSRSFQAQIPEVTLQRVHPHYR